MVVVTFFQEHVLLVSCPNGAVKEQRAITHEEVSRRKEKKKKKGEDRKKGEERRKTDQRRRRKTMHLIAETIHIKKLAINESAGLRFAPLLA